MIGDPDLDRMDIHNEVSPAQLAMQEGDPARYLRDDGSATEHRVAYCPPYRATDGTLVVHLTGVSGYVALCRVTPIGVTP